MRVPATPHAEYQRLTAAGVNPRSAAILAGLAQRPDDERAYWRQQRAKIRTTPLARAAHARAQAERRAARQVAI